ncbi:winged helix-turn-helix domain-containing protein [Vibrio owensii]|uniref:winged helix-turn-helix domain-containing protein n=2 Tax=Vibrio owensii TaxID=696485 RepID=UPI000997850C|nr:winged helix-turn-helix domain-containing protein [Vibrio owensii]AQW60352.1 transcriptional regulator [Vibrio owensii]
MRPQQIDSIEVPIGNCTLKRTESGAELILGNGKSFSITIPESCILDRLCKSPGDVVVKDELILEAWGSAEIIGPNSLPVAITNLRKVLEIDNIKILNVPKKGYRIQIPKQNTDVKNKDKDSLIDEPSNVQVDALVTHTVESCRCEKRKFFLSIFMIFVCVYILFFWWLSWVNLECKELKTGQICHIEGDNPPSLLTKNKTGNYFYSTRSGLIELNNEEQANDK